MSVSANKHRFDVMGIDDALKLYKREWTERIIELDANISHLLEWIKVAATTHELSHKIRVVIWKQSDGVLKGLVPIRIQYRTLCGIPIKTLEVGANLVSYHPDWLALCKADSTFDDLIFYASCASCQAVHFSGVPDGSITARKLYDKSRAGYTCIQRVSESSPILHIDTDWDEYLARCTKKWRYVLKKQLRFIKGNPDIEIRWYEGRDDLNQFLDILLRIESRSWKAKQHTAIRPNGIEHRYYQRLLPWLADINALMANVVTLSGVPISYNLCYMWNGEMGSMKTSYDESYARISPGTLAYFCSVRHAFKKGMKLYDFLGDKAQHKTKWTSNLVHHMDYLFLLPSLSSRLARILHSLRHNFHDRITGR